METFAAFYWKAWPKVGAVAAMALGGGAVLARPADPAQRRALAVMNSLTMAAHQFEEYVEPGTFPGEVNGGLFKSRTPRTAPFNTRSAAVANAAFSALYLPPVLFPAVPWLGLPPVLLGFVQAVAHGLVAPRLMGTRYSAGALTAALLHVPIGVKYLQSQRAAGPIARNDWLKAGGVLALFFLLVSTAHRLLGGDQGSAYAFTEKQMGPFTTEAAPADADADTAAPAAPV